ncbi:MAG: AAA family ATPase [Phycisphaeraceae bacterium]|nr:MAG: AAA family ATPase [Phycisphaeraceae bacterium]
MLDQIARLRKNVASVYLGEAAVIDRVIRCLLARGHALIEDVPGVGKTVLASSIARSIAGTFSRIQLTPDMLPADVIGVTIFDREGHRFEFRRGPIFANIVLADEINRTTPRTQTALLEAMSDGSISIDGVEHKLPPPFIVLATQNPYEFEGTYLLPENQLDRFLMRISLGYPSAEAESTLLELRPSQTVLDRLEPVLSAAEVVTLQQAVDRVKLSGAMRDYIVRYARATREHDDIEIGLSPRGSLALAHAARATAFMAGRDHVIPEDVIENITPVCAHRVFLKGGGGTLNWSAAAAALDDVLRTVGSPA